MESAVWCFISGLGTSDTQCVNVNWRHPTSLEAPIAYLV